MRLRVGEVAIMKAITRVIICTTLILSLASCNTADLPQATTAPQQVSEPEWETLLSTETLKVIDLGTYPGLELLSVRMALQLNIHTLLSNWHAVNSNAMNQPRFNNAFEIARYAMDVFWQRYYTEDELFRLYPDTLRDDEKGVFRIQPHDMEAIVQKAFAIDGVEDALLLGRSYFYDFEADVYMYPIHHETSYGYGGYWARNVQITIKQLGNDIKAEILWTDDDRDPVLQVIHYVRNNETPDTWRLHSSESFSLYLGPERPILHGSVIPFSLDYLGRTYVGRPQGVIGNTVYTAWYADGTLTISALDEFSRLSRSEKFDFGPILAYDDGSVGGYVQNELLIFRFREGSTAVFDKDLNLLLYEPLIKPIQDAMNENNGRGWQLPPGVELSMFGGSTLAPDLSNYVYITQDGVFRYDRASQEIIFLFEHPDDLSEYGSSLYLVNPRYNSDGTALYFHHRIMVTEAQVDFYRYDLISGESMRIMAADLSAERLSIPELSGFRKYFSPTSYYSTPKVYYDIWQNHLLHTVSDVGFFSETIPDRHISYLYPLGGEAPQEPLTAAEGTYEFNVAAVLSDGRAFFSVRRDNWQQSYYMASP